MEGHRGRVHVRGAMGRSRAGERVVRRCEGGLGGVVLSGLPGPRQDGGGDRPCSVRCRDGQASGSVILLRGGTVAQMGGRGEGTVQACSEGVSSARQRAGGRGVGSPGGLGAGREDGTGRGSVARAREADRRQNGERCDFGTGQAVVGKGSTHRNRHNMKNRTRHRLWSSPGLLGPVRVHPDRCSVKRS